MAKSTNLLDMFITGLAEDARTTYSGHKFSQSVSGYMACETTCEVQSIFEARLFHFNLVFNRLGHLMGTNNFSLTSYSVMSLYCLKI